MTDGGLWTALSCVEYLFKESHNFVDVLSENHKVHDKKKQDCIDCQNREVASAIIIAQTFVELRMLKLINLGYSYNTAKNILIDERLFEPDYDPSIPKIHPSYAEPYIKIFKEIQELAVSDLRNALNTGNVEKREEACIQIHRFEIAMKHMKHFCYPST